MKYYIFRNTTLERLFSNYNVKFSGYGEISDFDEDVDVYVWFYLLPVRANNASVVSEVESYFDRLLLVHRSIPSHKQLLIFTLKDFYQLKTDGLDFRLDMAVDSFNQSVVKFAEENKNVKLVDVRDFTAQYCIDDLMDWKYYFVSNMGINPKLAKDFQGWFARQIDRINLRRKKCLVLDLDNTLWGGILGEDGIDGIKIGGAYPGNAFAFFQQAILRMNDTGILLAICSKNDEREVDQLFRRNPFMVLRKEHFVSSRINWRNKADNIMEISQELNLGLDSLVFIDDNPTERELIKQLLPSVSVPDFPEHAYFLPRFIKDVQEQYFRVYALTEEDRQKTKQYKANIKRAESQQRFAGFEDYLKSLEMELTIHNANRFNITRIAQLTQKTNQFNLTTKRYSEEDIQGLLSIGALVFSVGVRDRFGDDGLTGAMIVTGQNGESARIDNFLMSCRVLGKGIESAFAKTVFSLLEQAGIRKVTAEFIPTNKNMLVKDFYEGLGFKLLRADDGGKEYESLIDRLNLETEPYYKIKVPI